MTPAKLPVLACPNCKENILDKGFYNDCTETSVVRETNWASVQKSGTPEAYISLDHEDDDHETVDHQCERDAFCSKCRKKLPWTLFTIRNAIDDRTVAEAKAAIAILTTPGTFTG